MQYSITQLNVGDRETNDIRDKAQCNNADDREKRSFAKCRFAIEKSGEKIGKYDIC